MVDALLGPASGYVLSAAPGGSDYPLGKPVVLKIEPEAKANLARHDC